jgi:hypothetical protein
MFFNKASKPSASDEEEKRVRVAERYQDQLDVALGIPDPAERLLRLDEIAASAREKSFETRMKLSSDAGPGVLATCFGLGGFFLAPLFVVGIVLQLPIVAAFAALPGICIGTGICLASWHNNAMRSIAENKTLFDGVDRVAAAAEDAAAATLRDHLPEITRSPKLDELHKRLPSLKALFAKVFEKQAPPAAPSPNAPVNKLNL